MRVLLAGLLCAAFAAEAQDAGALRARHKALQGELAASPFGRPLHVASSVSGGANKGEVTAVIEQPYAVVAAALARPANWCQILILQVNVKRCEAGEKVTAFITRKPRESVASAYQVDFSFAVLATGADYLHVALASPTGPVGTRDYELRLEAAPLGSGRTLLHMSYSYVLGFWGRMAMDAYLAGAGRDKVGFSVLERRPDGTAVYIDGVRGVVERSAMRYYLAIEAFIESPKELEARLRKWYAATARYPQLREPVGVDEYVQMKLKEKGSEQLSGNARQRVEPG